MSIKSFIKKVCVQTAVYWGDPQPDGFGGYTFNSPVEINCRWEDTNEVVSTSTKDGHTEEFVASSKILIPMGTEINLGGWVYLGTLDDLESNVINLSEIQTIEGAYKIRKISKVPLFRSTDQFVKTLYI